MTPRQRHVRTCFCFLCSFCNQALFSLTGCDDCSGPVGQPLAAVLSSSLSSSESHPGIDEGRRRWLFWLNMDPSADTDRVDVEIAAEGRAVIEEEDEDAIPLVELAVAVLGLRCLTEELGDIGKWVEVDGKSTSEWWFSLVIASVGSTKFSCWEVTLCSILAEDGDGGAAEVVRLQTEKKRQSTQVGSLERTHSLGFILLSKSAAGQAYRTIGSHLGSRQEARCSYSWRLSIVSYQPGLARHEYECHLSPRRTQSRLVRRLHL